MFHRDIVYVIPAVVTKEALWLEQIPIQQEI